MWLDNSIMTTFGANYFRSLPIGIYIFIEHVLNKVFIDLFLLTMFQGSIF